MLLRRGLGSVERQLAQSSTILLLSQKRVSAQEESKTLKSGLAGSVGSPPKLLKVANSVSNSGSKTESTNLKRDDLETQSQTTGLHF